MKDGRESNPRKVPCQQIREELTDYLLRELPVEQSWLIREHLRNCPECTAEAERISRTLDFMKTMTSGDDAQTLPQSVRKRLARALLHPVLDWICIHHRLVAWCAALGALALTMLIAWLCSFKPETVVYWLK